MNIEKEKVDQIKTYIDKVVYQGAYVTDLNKHTDYPKIPCKKIKKLIESVLESK